MDIAVVGAGLAGLAAANELVRSGANVTVLEAADGPGGRVRTDEVDGFRLDRGFQILLEAYPEARAMLDYDDLELRAFTSGAMVRVDGGFCRIGDPFREPSRLLETLRAPVGSPIDKARILAFRRAVGRGDLAELWERPETTAMTRLSSAGFSSKMIERFMTPLFAGITLDPELSGSSRIIEFVFRMLSSGAAVVPADGMGAISNQLAARLPEGTIRVSNPVAKTSATEVVMEDGERIAADHVVVATGQTESARLTSAEDRGWRGVTSVWFSADEAPVDEPILFLNGAGTSPINSLAVMSNVSARYAPAGSANIVVSSPSTADGLVEDMQAQLGQWFGPRTGSWEVLRVDRIEQAQPKHPVGLGPRGAFRTPEGVWICGDHTTDASINGALASGREVAQQLLAAKTG